MRKGAVDAILNYLNAPATVGTENCCCRCHAGGQCRGSARDNAIADAIAKAGGTPLAVAKDGRMLGVIHLKDIVKPASASVSPSFAAWASRP